MHWNSEVECNIQGRVCMVKYVVESVLQPSIPDTGYCSGCDKPIEGFKGQINPGHRVIKALSGKIKQPFD